MRSAVSKSGGNASLAGESGRYDDVYNLRFGSCFQPQLRQHLPTLGEPIRHCPELNASLADVIESVRAAGLEGLVAKRLDSAYEPGSRSVAWRKMRINWGQEFVIGGYTVGGKTFDALIVGCYENDRLLYVARTRNGFTPALRGQLYRRFRGLEIAECPFANLPEARSGRCGQGLIADKMKECRWLKPVLVAQFEYVELRLPPELTQTVKTLLTVR